MQNSEYFQKSAPVN